MDEIMKADTLITDPQTGEVLAAPGQALDDEQLYRLEMVGLVAAARSAAHAARATHYDALDPLQFWRQSNGRVEVVRWGMGPLEWLPSWLAYVPEWAGRM